MLERLIATFKEKESEIAAWLEAKRTEVGANPVYASVDIRNAGFKLAPVDTNLFPAGWNNLCPSYAKRAGDYFREYFDKHFPGTQCILILPEDHTRNLYYFSNIKRLQDILIEAGFVVKIGSINPEVKGVMEFQTEEGEPILLHELTRVDDKITIDGKTVCQILVNNDFSGGIPEILQGIKQNLLPTPEIGWHRRKKSEHFSAYDQLIEEFAEIVGLDSWYFNSRFEMVEMVDFADEESREQVAQIVDDLLAEIQGQYDAHGIETQPVVFVKNDAGTYGMAIMSVKSGDEIRNMNSKSRNKMGVGKGKMKVHDLIIQEGVPTTDRMKELVAEPVIYLVGNKPTGGFYRLNEERGDDENLNSRGMKFSKLCFHESLGYKNVYNSDLDLEALAELYKILATIASLAAGKEILDLEA